VKIGFLHILHEKSSIKGYFPNHIEHNSMQKFQSSELKLMQLCLTAPICMHATASELDVFANCKQV